MAALLKCPGCGLYWAGALRPLLAPPEVPGTSSPLAPAGRDSAEGIAHQGRSSSSLRTMGNLPGHPSSTCNPTAPVLSNCSTATHRELRVLWSWVRCVGFSKEHQPIMKGCRKQPGFLLSRSQGSHQLLLGKVMKLPKLERTERAIQPMLGSGKLCFHQTAWDDFSLSLLNDVSEQHNSHLVPCR